MAPATRKRRYPATKNGSRLSKRTNRSTNAISASPLISADRSPSASSITPSLDSKPTCFRISGFPQDWSRDKLWEALVYLDPSLKDLTPLLDLFPSCYGNCQTALLNFDVCTDYFKMLEPNNYYRKEIKDVSAVIFMG